MISTSKRTISYLKIQRTLNFHFCSENKDPQQFSTRFQSFKSPRIQKLKSQEYKPSSRGSEETQSDKQARRLKEQKLLKDFEEFKKVKDDQFSNIPPNLVIKNLQYPPSQSQIILLGVEKRNSMHASFIHDCMVNLKPGLVTTQIAPDMPYFIRTKIAYEEAWKRFVKGNFDYKFYVNPEPASIYDIMLNSDSIRELVGGGIATSPDKFELGSLFMYTMNHLNKKFEVDAFLTPLLYLYNNPHIQTNLVVNDYPFLKFRNNVNRIISISDLKDIYKQFREVLESQGTNTMFDPQMLKPDLFIRPKISYIAESIRNSSYTSKHVLAIVDRHAADDIESYWMTMKPQPSNLSTFLKNEYFSEKLNIIEQQLLGNSQKMQNPIMTEEGLQGFTPEERESYIEYIEKHVLLDLMIEPLVKESFVKYKVFPYSGKGYIGHRSMIQQIFVMLDHFYHQHTKPLRDVEPQSFDERQMHAAPNDFKENKQV